MITALAGIEDQIFRIINKAWSNPLFDFIMPYVTRLGTGEVIFAVALVLLVVGWRSDKRKLAILLLAGSSVSYYAVSFLKDIVARPRPFAVLAGVNLVCGTAGSYSFPSGHATMAFMAATILSAFYGRWWLLFYALAAAVGFSRVYVGVHFFTDVAAGAVLGCLIGTCLLRVSDTGLPR